MKMRYNYRRAFSRVLGSSLATLARNERLSTAKPAGRNRLFIGAEIRPRRGSLRQSDN